MSKHTLPSGAILEITLAPFADANNLKKAIASEMKGLHLTSEMSLTDANFLKDAVFTAIASERILACVEQCFKRCTYNGLKINADTFEPAEARGDYDLICYEVVKENLLPFLKGLSAQLKDMFPKKQASA